ncbi:hypothetical protein BR93DRAFT_221503 [Coniochaeta sp. PMI_546]|nr:hypothetical protein BR93DRAFT_221503 [Coniochaeta sp. PMI_546]
MPSTSRTRRSRAPSPESQPSPTSDLFTKVAKGVLEYSIHHYLTQQTSSTSAKASPTGKSKEMPSKHTSGSDQSTRAAFGFSSGSGSRRDDPTHELISHLLRGAAALAVRHFISKRGKKKEKEKGKDKAKAPRSRDEFVGAPVPERPRHRHHHRRRPHRHVQGPRTEIVVALDSLSSELARTTTQIRRLAGGRRPHRHRDGRCDVYEGLVSCAGRLEAETERVRTGVNNIRNLGEGQLGGMPGGRYGREMYGREWHGVEREEVRDGSWVRTRPVPEARAGSYVRTRPNEERAGSYVRTRAVPKEKEGGVEERRARVKGEEDRGRKRTRSR